MSNDEITQSKEQITVNLKKIRINNNLSQSQLAKKIQDKLPFDMRGEYGKQVISKLENGKRTLTLQIARAYAEVFNITIEDIFSGIIKNNDTVEIPKMAKTFQELLYKPFEKSDRLVELLDEAHQSIWNEKKS